MLHILFTFVLQSIKLAKDAWHEMAVKHEIIEDEKDLEEEAETEEGQMITTGSQAIPEVYVTRSGRVSHPAMHLIKTAYAVIHEMCCDNFREGSDNITKEIVKCTYAMRKALLFQKAMVHKPDEAMQALQEEFIKAIEIDIWHPVHLRDLTDDQEKLIIPQMINYLEKYKPDNTFDKFKVRVLVRGDKQVYTGESEGPVARIESLMMLLAIAAFKDLAIFKVDIGSAFMGTPIPEDVKHKWLKLEKKVVELLLELENGKYKDYALNDGSVIVEMKKCTNTRTGQTEGG